MALPYVPFAMPRAEPMDNRTGFVVFCIVFFGFPSLIGAGYALLRWTRERSWKRDALVTCRQCQKQRLARSARCPYCGAA